MRLSISLAFSMVANDDSDGNIRYFEYQNDKFEFLSEYKSADPQRGIAFLPKRGVNVHENEVTRAFKTVNDTYIEPISFIVPRRAEVFQDDIYPPTIGLKPAMSAGEWFGGKEGIPPKIDLAAIYAGEEPTEVTSDYKSLAREPSPKPSSPVKKVPEPEPTPSALKGPPPSMNEQTASIKNLASKYDDEEGEEQDDSSSFEEVAKPIDRSAPPSQPHSLSSPAPTAPAAPASRNLGDALSSVENKPDDFAQASQIAASQSTAAQIEAQAAPLSQTKPEPVANQLPSTPKPPASLSSGTTAGTDKGVKTGNVKPEDEGVQASLAEIKSLLEQQQRAMKSQNETIGRLTQEVEGLRARIGER